ncbi:tRNA lysidine(34) synthetase TilS [Candidatus Peregrinibacteria bacterium]|nr:tRNA lysidine(34) synthetase TilS [Candidatus Peregrinibacteria bacterium]
MKAGLIECQIDGWIYRTMVIVEDYLIILYNDPDMDIINSTKSVLSKIPSFRRVVVGVSGGADSVVLAHVLNELGYDITIAHLNHKLRGRESDGDELYVMNLAKMWGVGYVGERINIPREGNLENNARNIRYEFLEKVRQECEADYIAVAHHFDDQIETVLMHMARGAGLRGRIGMRPLSDKLIRPLLEVRRKDIEEYAKEKNLSFRTDKSNFDTNLERCFWRQTAIPALGYDDIAEEVRETIKEAGEKLEVLLKKAERWIFINFSENKFNKEHFNMLPNDVKSEVLIQILGPNDLYEASINRLIEFLQDGQSGRMVKVKNLVFSIEHSNVLVRQYIDASIGLPKAQITTNGIKWGKWIIKANSNISDCGIQISDLYVRQWKAGDKFRPSGMNGTKKLQDFFVDSKIPLHLRMQIPIIVNEKDDIISVGDLRIADGYENLKHSLLIKSEE